MIARSRTRTRTVLTLVAVAMAIVGLTTTSASADVVLRVDFNSNQDSGGDSTTAGDPGLSAAATNQAGWSSYHANHEVIAEFTTADYGGITVTPDWPNTTDNRVRQSIDRGTGNDDNWDDAAGDLNLVTDWIGIDTRTGNGGNGNWDGATGTPTYMTLALGGLAAGNYDWTSFHHDTEHCHGPFAVWLSTDGGATFAQLDDGVMTDSTTGGSPDSGAIEVGPDANALSSTYHTSFSADGVNAVVFRFAPYSDPDPTAAHRQIWGMNGFELSEVPSPVGYWNLDETSGEIAQDSSGNGYDGILSADPDPAPLWTIDPGRGNVLEFVPGLDSVDCGPGVSAGQDLTVALWINPADVDLMRPISCFDGGDYSTGPGWLLMLRHDDWDGQVPPNAWFRITGGVDPETEEDAWNAGDLWIDECWAPGEWVHMAFTFDEDSDTLSGYINGELAGVTVVPESRSVASDTNPLIMGHGGGIEQYEGLMDEVSIYDVALTETEIWNLVYPISITIDNPGFEDPVLAEDDWTWLDVPGWTWVGGEGPGIWRVTNADFDPVVVPEGQNVLYTENAVGDAGGVAQVLTETFAADTDYTLTVEVGNSNYYYNGGYSVQLLAGGVVIAEDNDTLWPENSKWATSTVEYTYDPADAALVGQPLEIRLLTLALDKDSPPAGEVVGVEFDNVTLSYVPAAPVSLIEAPVPVGHWTLDEGAGTTVADVSGNGNDGTIMDNPDLDDPTWIDGIYGSALEFHGTGVAGTGGDHIDCGNDASLDITGPISIALWIRPDADDPEGKGTSGGETAPMAKATSDWSWQVRYGWAGGPTPYMSFTFNTSPRAWVGVGKNLERFEWCHIACSYDGTTLKCYLNGVETDSTPMGEIHSSADPVLIGSDGWGSDWTGAIDDVRIYDRGLSADEIADIAGL